MSHIRITIYAALALFFAGAQAAQAQQGRCRRNSICSILVKHAEQKFAKEIEEQFLYIPVSERFNEHNLSVRVVSVNEKNIEENALDGFVRRNQIASRLVARWFDRDILSGACTVDTVRSRGLWDATVFDAELARRTARGTAMLEDAGEDLIGNTYLLLNEVRYIDKSKKSSLIGKITGGAMAVLSLASGGNAADALDSFTSFDDIISSYKGFSVRVTTRLYQLIWDKEASGMMFSQLWSDGSDPAKAKLFEENRGKFKMKFVGEVTSKGGTTSFLGINEDEPQVMVRKACARAIDENVADLQHKFEPFRIKTPIATAGKTVTAPIGMKEGIEGGQKFEVLEVEEKDGRTKYHRIGVVKAVDGKIWDNRFMASEEKATGSALRFTTFEKVSGGNFMPGNLLRELD